MTFLCHPVGSLFEATLGALLFGKSKQNTFGTVIITRKFSINFHRYEPTLSSKSSIEGYRFMDSRTEPCVRLTVLNIYGIKRLRLLLPRFTDISPRLNNIKERGESSGSYGV